MNVAPRIDAHQHFWQLGRFDYGWLDAPQLNAIRRSYLPDDLRPLLETQGVQYSIFVQTQHNEAETQWVLDLAETHPFIAGVVGWVDLTDPDLEASLERLVAEPKFVGVRHVTHDEPDDDFIVRPDVLRGLGLLEKFGIPFDLLFYVRHLRHALTIARHCPELALVVDHLAKPPIKYGTTDAWEAVFREVARVPTIFCKISGLVTEADWEGWRTEDLRPYTDIALDAFGPERCMFGSDWPVCELAASYEQVFQAAQRVTDQLSTAERAHVFGQTATRFYRRLSL